MRKFLNKIGVIQIAKGKNGWPIYRVNPYNPLSYISLLLILIVGLLMFGFVGFWKEVDLKRNLFKYPEPPI